MSSKSTSGGLKQGTGLVKQKVPVVKGKRKKDKKSKHRRRQDKDNDNTQANEPTKPIAQSHPRGHEPNNTERQALKTT